MRFKTPEDQICPICTDTRRAICDGVYCKECHFDTDDSNEILLECENSCTEHNILDLVSYYKTLYQLQKENNMYLEYFLYVKNVENRTLHTTIDTKNKRIKQLINQRELSERWDRR